MSGKKFKQEYTHSNAKKSNLKNTKVQETSREESLLSNYCTWENNLAYILSSNCKYTKYIHIKIFDVYGSTAWK